MKKICWISLFIISLISCSSISKIIPGQNETENSNLYYEYYNLANEFYSLQKYDKALDYYTKAMDNQELYWDSYYKIAIIHSYNQEYKKSIEMFTVLLHRDEKNISIKSSIAYMQAMDGNFEESIKIYKELITENPEDFADLENLICIYFQLKDYTNAQEYFNHLKTLYPDSKKIPDFEKELEKSKSSSESGTDKQ